jgi:phosphatidate cytidylyltransferase
VARLLTAAVAVPLALAAIFGLPGWAFFALCAVLIDWGAVELVALLRHRMPGTPTWTLPFLVPVVALVLCLAAPSSTSPALSGLHLSALCLLLSVGVGGLVLLGRTPIEHSLAALGALAFGIPYFALPIASLYHLQQIDPWLVFLLVAIVWLGDTAAFYFGTLFGRHRMAPVVSPKKTWEGAVAGFVTGLLATVVWSVWNRGGLDPRVLAIGALTAVAAQVGDLVESMLKRGAGVKDSGNVLPGHGGMLDRIDALLFAAPVLLAGLWLFGFEVTLP